MRYIIKEDTDTKKFYIWDNKENKPNSEGFDIILDIISDKYAIAGKADTYLSRSDYYKYYKYGIIDMKGNVIFDFKYEYIYPTDTIIYCKPFGFPFNQLTYLGHYRWVHKNGTFLSNEPFVYYNNENAILRGEYFKEYGMFSMKEGYVYKLIDGNGIVLKEEKIGKSQSFNKLLKEEKNTNQQLVELKILSQQTDSKWSFLNEITERSERFCNFGSIRLGEVLLNNVHFNFAQSKFLLIFQLDENYNGDIIREESSTCCAVLNDKGKVIYYSKEGFKVMSSVFIDRIVIDNKYILDYDGNLFSMPEEIEICSMYSFSYNYIRIKNKEKSGFMDNKGNIVIPTIFPKDEWCGFDEEVSQCMWEEYLGQVYDSTDDAFEGDSDAYWNID